MSNGTVITLLAVVVAFMTMGFVRAWWRDRKRRVLDRRVDELNELVLKTMQTKDSDGRALIDQIAFHQKRMFEILEADNQMILNCMKKLAKNDKRTTEDSE